MELKHELIKVKVPVDVLYVSGRLDGSNFKALINKTKQLIGSGSEYLLLDLAACDFLSSAGLFAMHSIALITHQLEPFDPEDGWQALYNMQNKDYPDLKGKFKIVNLQPKVAHTLEISGISSFLDIHTDSIEALAAFGPIQG